MEIVSEIVDAEYYASDYSTKEQPHADNLLHTLHDSLEQHLRNAAERVRREFDKKARVLTVKLPAQEGQPPQELAAPRQESLDHC